MTENFTTKRLLFTAYLWNMLGKLIVRSLGVISTLILVRLLDPEDFGIVAIGILIIGFFEVLSNSGVNRYLILLPDPSVEDYNAAWTLNIFLRTALNIALMLMAGLASQLFENPELELVIYVMCMTEMVYSFRNIGMVKLEKELNYKPINTILVYAKIASFSVCLASAFYFKNYYALLIGNAVNIVVGVLLSYILVGFRPKFYPKFKADMFIFTKFLLLRNIVSYTRSQLDILLVGKRFGDVGTGQFSIARQFAAMPQTELVSPAMQPIFSGLSKFKNEPEKLMANSIQVLQLGYLFLVPCAFGLLAIAEPFTLVVLGEKWLPVKDFIGVLALLMIVFITQSVLTTLYDANNKIKYSMFGDLVGIILLVCSFALFPVDNIEEFSYLRVAVGAVSFIFFIFFGRLFFNFPILKVLEILLVPLSLSVLMYFTVDYSTSIWASCSLILRLVFPCLVGFSTYFLLLIIVGVVVKYAIKSGQLFVLIESLPFDKLKSLAKFKR